MDVVYRTLGVVGVFGGITALLAFAGVLEGEKGNPSLLVLGVVFLGFGVPSFIKWLRTF